MTFCCFYLKESPSKKKKKDGSFTKKITKKVNCLGSGVDRSSCPYGNIPDMNEVTLEHLHRIANKANFKSTFEDVNEASDSDAECGSLLDKNYNEPWYISIIMQYFILRMIKFFFFNCLSCFFYNEGQEPIANTKLGRRNNTYDSLYLFQFLTIFNK